MTSVILIQPPISFTNRSLFRNELPLLGLPYLAAVLKARAISFRAINDYNGKYSIQDIVDLCRTEQTRILGISSNTLTIRAAVQLAEAVKGALGDRIHLALGGVHLTLDPGIIERYQFFDSGVAGEAEQVIAGYIDRILGGEKLSGVTACAAPQDLDSLPFPDFDCVENSPLVRGMTIPLLGTRGCPHKCGYCCVAALTKKVRSRSPENIVEEIRRRLPLTNRFQFVDDAATVNRKHIVSLCERMLAQGLKVHFEMITRLDLLDRDMVRLLKQAGCYKLAVGIESGSERIRNEVINKKLSEDEIIRGMKLLKDQHIMTDLFFMVGHPEETHADVAQTLQYPLKLERMGLTNIDLVGFHLTNPFPKTAYFDWGVEKDKISPHVVDDYVQGRLGDGFYGHWPYLVPDGFTLDELKGYVKSGYKAFYFRPRYVLRRIRKDLSRPRNLIADVKQALSVLRRGTSLNVREV